MRFIGTPRRVGSYGIVLLLLLLVGRLWSGGYLDRSATWRYPAKGRPAAVSVLFFSGDSGMRGMGPYVTQNLADNGIDTTAISTSTIFRLGLDRRRLDRVVAAAIVRAEREARGRPLVVIGQSYGADVLQTGLADLPASLRAGIARIILIVPGTGTYYRADPTGLSYYLAPDSRSIVTASTLRWAPLSCIFGREDEDDLCGSLDLSNAIRIGLPGNHYLDHDKPRLAATVLREVWRTVAGR
jgi:type IV secretory pathway VirJ component